MKKDLCLSWMKTQLSASTIDSTTKDNMKQTHTHETCVSDVWHIAY